VVDGQPGPKFEQAWSPVLNLDGKLSYLAAEEGSLFRVEQPFDSGGGK